MPLPSFAFKLLLPVTVFCKSACPSSSSRLRSHTSRALAAMDFSKALPKSKMLNLEAVGKVRDMLGYFGMADAG